MKHEYSDIHLDAGVPVIDNSSKHYASIQIAGFTLHVEPAVLELHNQSFMSRLTSDLCEVCRILGAEFATQLDILRGGTTFSNYFDFAIPVVHVFLLCDL